MAHAPASTDTKRYTPKSKEDEKRLREQEKQDKK